ADSLVHSTEKALGEHGDKFSEDERNAIQTALDELKSAKDGDNAEDIRAKTNTLVQASMKLSAAMYKAQGGGETDEGAAPADDGGDDAGLEGVGDSAQKSA